jgi:molecular chaperone DnaK (HSP70)
MVDLIDNFFKDEPSPENEESDTVIGIDLGTSNSCCCIWRNGTSEVIPDENGNRTIPSIISITGKHTYIGHEAKNLFLANPDKNIFYEIK